MPMKIPRIATPALMLSIVLWGTLLGGVAYSHLVYFPVYLSALPASAVVVTGPYGLHEAIFWMLIHPVLILSLGASLALNWRSRYRRQHIAGSMALYVLVLVVTWLYFVPELTAFATSQASTISPAEWLERGQRWQHRSWLRGAVMYACIVPLLLALARPAGETAAPPA
jgi:hypothetical protein